MPRHENHPNVEAQGRNYARLCTSVVVDTGAKTVLADLTPRGLEIVPTQQQRPGPSLSAQ
jgi:hypothetical protein